MSTLLPERETVQEVLLIVDHSFSGDVCVFTNEEEKEAILDKLYEADLSGLEDVEPTGIGGPVVEFKLLSDDGEKVVLIVSNTDAQYLVLRNGEEQLCKKGPVETFDFRELDRLSTAVLGNRDDPEYSGRVELVDSDYRNDVNKSNTALAKAILDNAISNAATTEEGEDITYDVMFTIGDTSYGISSDTGHFFRQEAEEKVYAQLEEQQLRLVKIRIGVFNATS